LPPPATLFDLGSSSGRIHIGNAGYWPFQNETFDLIRIPEAGTIQVPGGDANALLNADTPNGSLSVVNEGGMDILRATSLVDPPNTPKHRHRSAALAAVSWPEIQKRGRSDHRGQASSEGGVESRRVKRTWG
jgi:hypothetical protein